MKKLLTTILSALLTLSAQAVDLSNENLLSMVLAESGDIKVYYKTDEVKQYKGTLSKMIAEHLLTNSKYEEGEVILTSTSFSCEADGALGSTYFSCSLVLMDGDYSHKDGKYEGPHMESAQHITITIKYSHHSKKFYIEKEASALLAG